MRPTLLALATLAVASAFAAPIQPAQARDYPWCAQYSERAGGGRNCGFVSFAQCQATAMGSNAWCQPNPRYTNGRGDGRHHRRYRTPYERD
jgi:hypothetical protein